MGYSDLMVLGCSVPSEVKVLLKARGFLNLVEPDCLSV